MANETKEQGLKLVSNVSQQINGMMGGGAGPMKMVALLGVVAAVIAGLIFAAAYTRTGGYVTIYSNLQPGEVGEGLTRLSASNIKGRVEAGGTAIAVPSSQRDQALMLLMEEGISSSGIVGYEAMDASSIGRSKAYEDRNYHRIREGELARTLMSIPTVERARVHLAMPSETLFVASEERPSASVFLQLRRGGKLDERKVTGIVQLVASSIENLTPERVSVIDQDGNLLNTPDQDSNAAFTASQVQYKVHYEDNLKERIETMLEKMVGRGKVVARVQADFDFSTQREVSEIYNPEDQDPIKRSEQISREQRGAGAVAASVAGPPGSGSNLPIPETESSAKGIATGDYRVDETAEYAVSRTYAESTKSVPTPMRISVGVLVDGVYEEITAPDGTKTTQFRPRDASELANIEKLVKMAMGFQADEVRQDQIAIECAPFQTDQVLADDSMFGSYNFDRYLELGVRWGVFALLGLLAIMFVLRPAIHALSTASVTLAGPQALPAGGPQGALMGARGMGGMGHGADSDGGGTSFLGRSRELHGESSVAHGAGGSSADAARTLASVGNAMLMNAEAQAQAKEIGEVSRKLQHEVLESAKSNPQKTVTLMRQWMTEA